MLNSRTGKIGIILNMYLTIISYMTVVFKIVIQRAIYYFQKILLAAFVVKTCISYKNSVLLLQFIVMVKF